MLAMQEVMGSVPNATRRREGNGGGGKKRGKRIGRRGRKVRGGKGPTAGPRHWSFSRTVLAPLVSPAPKLTLQYGRHL